MAVVLKQINPEFEKKLAAIKKLHSFGKSQREAAAYATFPEILGKEPNEGLVTITNSVPRQHIIKLVGNLMKFVVPDDKVWGELGVINEKRLTNALKKQLESVRDLMWRHIDDSGFYSATRQAFKDMIILGAGVLYVYWDNGLRVRHIPAYELAWKFNEKGQADHIINEFELTKADAISQYPDVAKCPGMETLKEWEMVKLQRVIMPKNMKSKKEMYTLIVTKDKYIVKEQTLKFNPYIVFRWDQSGKSQYGTSPVINCLQDIENLYTITAAITDSAEYAARGLYWTRGTVDRDGEEPIKPGDVITSPEQLHNINDARGMPIAFQELQMLETNIAEQLYYFQPPVAEVVKSTAFGLSQLERAFYNHVSAPVATLEKDFLKPFLMIVAKILLLNKIIADTSRMILDNRNMVIFRNTEMTVVATSGLKLARQKHEAQSQRDGFLSVADLIELKPELLARFDLEAITISIAKGFGLDETFINDDEQTHDAKVAMAQIAEDSGAVQPGTAASVDQNT